MVDEFWYSFDVTENFYSTKHCIVFGNPDIVFDELDVVDEILR